MDLNDKEAMERRIMELERSVFILARALYETRADGGPLLMGQNRALIERVVKTYK